MTIRTALWEVAMHQHGFFTLDDARELGFDEVAVRMMVTRNKLEHVARGVYQFPQMPASEVDPYLLAVLWTGAPEAALSHETALAVRGHGDVNPDRIHITVATHRRIRRSPTGPYALHYEDLPPQALGWWQGVRTVTAATALQQCLDAGTPGYLVRQAIDAARGDGQLTAANAAMLMQQLDMRYANA